MLGGDFFGGWKPQPDGRRRIPSQNVKAEGRNAKGTLGDCEQHSQSEGVGFICRPEEVAAKHTAAVIGTVKFFKLRQ